jgi:cob(I)alamin adenosyltransferase
MAGEGRMDAPRIYTRTGDGGMTGLYSGERVPKYHGRMEVCGTLDELNCQLGAAAALGAQPETCRTIRTLQDQIFKAGTDFATASGDKAAPGIVDADITSIEQTIDSLQVRLPPLRAFILPGGSPAAAHLHLARAVCRRAERTAAVLAKNESVNPHATAFLNRLSDLLFVLARHENHLAGTPEILWNA